ncbi:MAG: LacI family transcriptional regulator [Lentisphaerae bacterium]|nr:LacI family transcriptional regulator [Lentisphaerota bacterium]
MKKGFTKNEVRKALSDYIRTHAGTDRLPPLRDISRDLGVSIYLIRKHLDAMQREGILQTRNRIGMFLTPQQSQRQTVGIVFNPEWANPYIDFPDIYAGVISSLAQRFYLIRTLSFKKLSDLPKLVRSLGLTGIVWIDKTAVNLPVLMDRISVKHGIPLVLCGQNLFLTRPFGKTTNTVSLDWEKLAKLRADYFVAHGCRHIVYFAVNSPSLKLFRAELAKYGIELPDEMVISRADELGPRLSALRRKYPVDGILVDGLAGFYENLFAFLHQHPDIRPLLSIEDNPQVRNQLQLYPDIEIPFQFESWRDFYFRMGEQAAAMLERAITDNPIQPSEKSLFEAVEPNFIQWKNHKKQGGKQL